MIKKHKKSLLCLQVLITLFLVNIPHTYGKQNIILNREDYIKEMKFKVKNEKDKKYEILKPLRRNQLIIETSEGDNE